MSKFLKRDGIVFFSLMLLAIILSIIGYMSQMVCGWNKFLC